MKFNLYIDSWKLRSKLKIFKRRVEASRKIIQKSLSSGTFAISWSGGKDSTAMTHLIRSIAPDIPIVTQFDDCDWPEKHPYIDRVCEAQGWEIYKVFPSFSIWDAAIKTDLGNESICAQSHYLTKEGFIKPLADKIASLVCDGVYMGLRAQE